MSYRVLVTLQLILTDILEPLEHFIFIRIIVSAMQLNFHT
jgi:hypothetical protein